MKKLLLVGAAALAFAAAPSAVLADPPSGDPPGCGLGTGGDDDNDNTGNGCPGGSGGAGGDGGAGGSGGTGVGIGIGVGVGTGGDATIGDITTSSSASATGGAGGSATATAGGGSATIEEGAVDNTNVNTAVNSTDVEVDTTNIQGQQQGQLQGQLQGQVSVNENDNSNSADNSSTNDSSASSSGNTTTVTTITKNPRQHRNVHTAYAPTVVGAGGSDSCLGSVSGGGQTGLFGISLGGTTKDRACQRIKYSRRAEELGMPDVACQMLALDDEFAEALRRAAKTCDMSQFAARMLPVQPTVPVDNAVIPQPTPVQVPSYGQRGN